MIKHQNPVSASPDNELLDTFSWRLLLPDVESPRVLSIMPPDVEHLAALASLFGDVTSLEQELSTTTGSIEAGHALRENIARVAGSVLSLPFDNESFHLVVVNEGAVGEYGEDRNSGLWTDYATFLDGLRRVLKTDGCVCLCTRSRWDYRQLLSPNNGEKRSRWGNLGNLMRNYRRLSNQWLSPGQYATALRETGFSGIKSYVVFPDFGKPRFIVPFEAGVYRYYRHHFTYPQGNGPLSMVAKLIARSGVDRFLESHVLVTGVKS